MGTGGKKTIGIAEYVLRLRDEMTGTVQNIAGGMQSMMAPAMLAVGDMAGAMGDKIMAGIEKSTSAAMDFETAFVEVRKTIDGSEEEYKALNDQIREMSMTMPVAAEELARIAGAAGQLGVSKENVIEFTRTIADLSVSSNLTSEAGAMMLAKFSAITQMPEDKYRNLASAIVEVGANSKTTEADIMEMALRIAKSGEAIGLTEGEIIGFSAALSSVGMEAEAGGSAISKAMIDIQVAVDKGGDDLEGFASVAGMSADAFADKWKSAPAAAMTDFTEGLGRVNAEGGSLFLTLESLGITEVRLRDSMVALAGSGDLLSRSINMGNEAFTENTALTREAEVFYGTTANQLRILQNNYDELWRIIGESLIPVLIDMVPKIVEIVKAIGEWMKQHPDFVANLTMTAASVGILGQAFGWVTDAIMPLLAIFATWNIAAMGVGAASSGAAAGLLSMAGGFLAVAAGGAAMALGVGVLAVEIVAIGDAIAKTVTTYGQLSDSQDRLSASLETYMDKLEAKGAAIDRDKVRSMEHGEAMKYLAEQEAQTGDSLLRAYIANAAGRAATDQEFAIAKNLSLNENLLREEAAYLASKGYADSFYMDLMTMDAENTNALLEEMGIRVDGQMQGYDAIRDLSTTLAQDQIAINKEATDQILADQENKVGLLGSIWQGFIDTISAAWNGLIGMIMSGMDWVGNNIGIPGMATGGMITGSGLVNVHKDELLLLPRGAEVVPKRHSEGVRAAMEGGGGGGVTININGPIVRQDSDIDAIASKVSKAIAGSSRSSMRRVGIQPNYGA